MAFKTIQKKFKKQIDAITKALGIEKDNIEGPLFTLIDIAVRMLQKKDRLQRYRNYK